MTLRVPLTLTIIPALTVSIAGQHFAIPRSAIVEIVRANGESVTLEHLGGAGVATIRGRRVPEISLATVLGLESQVEAKDRTLVVLRPAGGDVYALSVDRIHDHEELVVKPAAPAVMAAGLYAGTTLADDGRPILLLDPSGIAKCAGITLADSELHQALRGTEEEAETERETSLLLFRTPAGGRPHRLLGPSGIAKCAGVTLAESELHQALRGTEEEAETERETSLLLFRTLAGGRRAVPVMVVERIEDVPAEAISFGAGKL